MREPLAARKLARFQPKWLEDTVYAYMWVVIVIVVVVVVVVVVVIIVVQKACPVICF